MFVQCRMYPVILLATHLIGCSTQAAQSPAHPLADNPGPPATTVKLIFVHHSTGGNWLADPTDDSPSGGLGIALRNNNYYASATNYGWGPGAAGDRTDIPNWPEWFTGSGSTAILSALHAESGQNVADFGSWSRLSTGPGGPNEIIVFKSCFPNSNLDGNPVDPALSSPNDEFTVANAKAVYHNILTYFRTRQDKLFVVITAPPLSQGETTAAQAANARAFNSWLRDRSNGWLKGYAAGNVAVFDYFNVLTSHGGNAQTNDAGSATGNHHRWWNSAEQHIQTVAGNFSAYPSDPASDSHPTSAGQRKAAGEFVTLLNVFYHRWKAGQVPVPIYLPLIQKSAAAPPAGNLLQPGDLTYLGAFRLPGDDTPPLTFAYGGNAMTFHPAGDPGNSDAFPGSLFVMGHDRQAYGQLPNGNQVAEISIPVPVKAATPDGLSQAAFLQNFQNVVAGYFTNLDEIPKVGLQYLNQTATGPKIHLAWGQHLQEGTAASHAWFSPTLSTPNLQGVWFIGNQLAYSVNGYLFEIPEAWADTHASGRTLATGRMRDGGQGGMGPCLFAYRPWLANGSAPASGTHLSETPLLLYESAAQTTNIERNMNGYQHPDEWEGGAWITSPSGKSAVLFAGTKSNGVKYWYGFLNPAGAGHPCIAQAMVTDFLVCRMASGASCPAEDFTECAGHTSERGWWTTRFDAQVIFYNPADLAKVAAGTLNSWEPQPYAAIDIDAQLYMNPTGTDLEMLGAGDQRRFRIGDAAYDRANGLLYVLELYADGARPVVHVWRVG